MHTWSEYVVVVLIQGANAHLSLGICLCSFDPGSKCTPGLGICLCTIFYRKEFPSKEFPQKAAQGYLSQNVGRAQWLHKAFSRESPCAELAPHKGSKYPCAALRGTRLAQGHVHKAFSREKPSAQGLRTRLHKAVCTRLRTRFRTRPAQASESLVQHKAHKDFFQ